MNEVVRSFAVAAPLAFPGPFDHDLVVPPTSGFQKLDLDGPQTVHFPSCSIFTASQKTALSIH